MAATKMADGDHQTHSTVAAAKVDFARIRPSAAVPPFGMCPEPAPIKPSDLPKCAPHPASSLSRRTTRVPDPEKCGQLDGQYKLATSGFRVEKLELITKRAKETSVLKDCILVNIFHKFP
jgi:hypothetical protein